MKKLAYSAEIAILCITPFVAVGTVGAVEGAAATPRGLVEVGDAGTCSANPPGHQCLQGPARKIVAEAPQTKAPAGVPCNECQIYCQNCLKIYPTYPERKECDDSNTECLKTCTN
jgi:hypothetical protein